MFRFLASSQPLLIYLLFLHSDRQLSSWSKFFVVVWKCSLLLDCIYMHKLLDANRPWCLAVSWLFTTIYNAFSTLEKAISNFCLQNTLKILSKYFQKPQSPTKIYFGFWFFKIMYKVLPITLPLEWTDSHQETFWNCILKLPIPIIFLVRF